MPELPDLEVFKENIFKQLTSKRLIRVETFAVNKISVAEKTINDNLAGKDLVQIGRSGKELIFDFGYGKTIAVHLMLSGKTSILKPFSHDTLKYKIFSMQFENETVVFSDAKGLCTVKYPAPISKTPDAFGEDFTLKYFLDTAIKYPFSNVKAFLIDQKNTVRGIGNAYADEILYAARISPLSRIGKIPLNKMEALYNAIENVLRDAVSSIKQISSDIISGEERIFLKVHNKHIKTTENGYPIIIETVASKITYAINP